MSNTSSKEAKVVSFVNQKGGVGKTTLAFQTAMALALQNKSVLCLDLDPQGNLSLLLQHARFAAQKQDRKPEEEFEFHIFHGLINSVRELKTLHTPVTVGDILHPSIKRLDFIPSGSELSGLELTVANIHSPRPLILRKFLNQTSLIESYDWIIIDAPPTLGLLMVNILCVTDTLLIPFRPDQFSKIGLERLLDSVEEVHEMEIDANIKRAGLIPNLVERRRLAEDNLPPITQGMEAWQDAGIDCKLLASFPNRVLLEKLTHQGLSPFQIEREECVEWRQKIQDLLNFI